MLEVSFNLESYAAKTPFKESQIGHFYVLSTQLQQILTERTSEGYTSRRRERMLGKRSEIY